MQQIRENGSFCSQERYILQVGAFPAVTLRTSLPHGIAMLCNRIYIHARWRNDCSLVRRDERCRLCPAATRYRLTTAGYRNNVTTVVFVWDINTARFCDPYAATLRGPAQNTLSDVMAIVTFQSAWHTILAVVHLFSTEIKTTLDIQLVTLSRPMCSLLPTYTSREWC